MNVIDLFCGTGGFTYGFDKFSSADYEVIWGIDKKESAISTFKSNHADAEATVADIREYGPKKANEEKNISSKDVDVIVGGPPCQGFSSIRPDRSEESEDVRNGLYSYFIDYVDFFRPKYFIMENVVGLATHREGKTIERILEDSRELGYSVDWRILNGANFGLPQRRERLIMVGSRENKEIKFPSPTRKSKGKTIGYKDKSKVITAEGNLENFSEVQKLENPRTVMDAISDLPKVKSGEEKEKYNEEPANQYQELMRNGSENLSLHKATNHSEDMLEIIRNSGENRSEVEDLTSSGYSSTYSRLDPKIPSNTITVNFIHPSSGKNIHPFQHRALTPREGARIQSFPDSFIFEGTKTSIVEQIGNAVPPLLGGVLGELIKDIENSDFRADYSDMDIT